MSTAATVDGVALALLTSRMQGVVRAMKNTLARTGRSGVINTAQDFSCCIVTHDARLLAVAESLPIHVMRGPDLMARYMSECHPTLLAGDAFLHNSPYHGNTHAADHCLLVPVVDRDGRHRFTVVVKAHQADCGNADPTTYSAGATDVYSEGALIFPAVRVQQDYRDNDDVIRMCRARIRVPDQWWGDYLAMVGAARIGERMLLDLGAEIGWDGLEAYAEGWFDYSERRMVAAIRALPAGEITASTHHDPFPNLPDGVEVTARVAVDPQAGHVVVDLRDNPDCQPSGLNLTEAASLTAAMIGVFNSLGTPVPPNEGSLRRLEVRVRENCVVGIPRHPASCSVATTNLADRVTNAVQRGLAELGHAGGVDVGMAEVGSVLPPAWAVLSGTDPRTGEAFINQILLPSVTGGAGGPHADAWLTIGHVGNAGLMARDSVEIDEIHHPIRIERQHILPDTEGAGRHRGAPGALVEYGPTAGPIQVVYTSDGSEHPALGACGGAAGAPAAQYLRTADGDTPLGACAEVTLHPGQTIVSHSGGGGGYGPPGERSAERVRGDVAAGIVTRARARSVYATDVDTPAPVELCAC